jgi:excisionase family DNA binding protein
MKAKELVKRLEDAGYRGAEKSRSDMKHTAYSDLKYSIRILNNGDDTYSVEVPKLSGCYSTGRNKDECIANIVEAIELHLEGMKKIPEEDPMPAIEVVQDAPDADDYLVSLPEACKFLDVSDSTLRRYVKDGTVPAYNFGKEYKFKVQELSQFIDAHKVEPKRAKAR